MRTRSTAAATSTSATVTVPIQGRLGSRPGAYGSAIALVPKATPKPNMPTRMIGATIAAARAVTATRVAA